MLIAFRITLLLLFCVSTAEAQNLEYVRAVVKELCSEEMAGRGYVKDGDKKAALYIRDELKSAKVKSLAPDYFQSFGFPVVTFPAEVSFVIGGYALAPGEHFIVDPGSPAFSGTYNLVWVDSATIDNNASYQRLEKQFLRSSFIVVTNLRSQKVLHPERVKSLLNNELKAKGIIYAGEQKLTWSVSTNLAPFPVLHILDGLIKPHQLSATIVVESFLKEHTTQNVAGFIEGSKYKDSFIVFTAHYDHLGMMGKNAIFPGANDNASGVAMLLDLVHYYSEHKPEYSIAFIFFAGEEAGLFGSYYYTQNPLFPLKKIALLLNLDLMGTGDKGLTAVNATVFPNEFQALQLVNMDGEYLPVIAPRGKAQNSDHYYFSENGVKAFFFYLMGDYHFYHDVDDKAEALPLSRYNEAFKLITAFVKDFQGVH